MTLLNSLQQAEAVDGKWIIISLDQKSSYRNSYASV